MPDEHGSVLLVDDDTVSRLVLAHMLRRLGFAVVEADDVQPAAHLLETSDFGLVISDYEMPGGTGLQLLELLPADPRPAFVLVTGIAPDAASGSTNAPVNRPRRFQGPSGRSIDGYLTKPVSTRALRACLRDVLPPGDD